MTSFNLIKKLAFFVFLMLILSSSVFSQSKEDFEKIFLKETSDNDDNNAKQKFKNIKTLSYFPDTLPQWFFKPPTSSFESVFAVGISDPDLTPEEAVVQALHRAKSMAVLCNKSLIQYFRDIYTTEYSEGRYTHYGQRFDTYFKISGKAYADSLDFSVINKHFTRYNEAVVLVSYSPTVNDENQDYKDLFSNTLTALYIEAQMGEAFEPQAEYEYVSVVKPHAANVESAHFLFREKGNKFFSESKFQGKKNEFPLFVYQYADPSWPYNTDPLVSYSGLWSMYSKKLLRQLTLETEQSSVRIRTMDQQYSSEIQNLSREVAIKSIKLLINGIEFGVDSIGFDIQVQELK